VWEKEMSAVVLLPNFKFNQLVATYQAMTATLKTNFNLMNDKLSKTIEEIEDAGIINQVVFRQLKLPQFDDFARDMQQLFSRLTQMLSRLLHPDNERTEVETLMLFADKQRTQQFLHCQVDLETAMWMFTNLVIPIVDKSANVMLPMFKAIQGKLRDYDDYFSSLASSVSTAMLTFIQDNKIPQNWAQIFKAVKQNIADLKYVRLDWSTVGRVHNSALMHTGPDAGCTCNDVDVGTGDFKCECRYEDSGAISDVRIDGTLLSLHNFPSIQDVLKRSKQQNKIDSQRDMMREHRNRRKESRRVRKPK
jgi:hypothetical protein